MSQVWTCLTQGQVGWPPLSTIQSRRLMPQQIRLSREQNTLLPWQSVLRLKVGIRDIGHKDFTINIWHLPHYCTPWHKHGLPHSYTYLTPVGVIPIQSGLYTVNTVNNPPDQNSADINDSCMSIISVLWYYILGICLQFLSSDTNPPTPSYTCIHTLLPIHPHPTTIHPYSLTHTPISSYPSNHTPPIHPPIHLLSIHPYPPIHPPIPSYSPTHTLLPIHPHPPIHPPTPSYSPTHTLLPIHPHPGTHSSTLLPIHSHHPMHTPTSSYPSTHTVVPIHPHLPTYQPTPCLLPITHTLLSIHPYTPTLLPTACHIPLWYSSIPKPTHTLLPIWYKGTLHNHLLALLEVLLYVMTTIPLIYKHIMGPTYCTCVMYFMPYYGLFSRDIHILDLWWRSPLCSLLALCLCYMAHYDITMGHAIARDAPLWHNNG